MDIKYLVRYSSFQYRTGTRRASKPSYFQRRCMALHVGSGESETGRIKRTRSDNTEIIRREKKRESESERDELRMGCYYEEMLRSDPLNPLLLRNYGKFLHEVVGDVEKAGKCYERGIISNPGNAELLSLYGKLVWETRREKERAEQYMETAVQASPNDCYVAGAYAHFLWDAEEDDESEKSISSSPPLIEPS